MDVTAFLPRTAHQQIPTFLNRRAFLPPPFPLARSGSRCLFAKSPFACVIWIALIAPAFDLGT